MISFINGAINLISNCSDMIVNIADTIDEIIDFHHVLHAEDYYDEGDYLHENSMNNSSMLKKELTIINYKDEEYLRFIRKNAKIRY